MLTQKELKIIHQCVCNEMYRIYLNIGICERLKELKTLDEKIVKLHGKPALEIKLVGY